MQPTCTPQKTETDITPTPTADCKMSQSQKKTNKRG